MPILRRRLSHRFSATLLPLLGVLLPGTCRAAPSVLGSYTVAPVNLTSEEPYCYPSAINNNGDIGGATQRVNESEMHSFVFHDGKITMLKNPVPNSSWSVEGLNDSGQAVGAISNNANSKDNFSWGFLYTDGQVKDIGQLGEGYVMPRAINSQGQITGAARINRTGHAFLYTQGAMSDLNIPGSFSEGDAINSQGHIAGTMEVSFAKSHAFLYRDGSFDDLGDMDGKSLNISDMNDADHIVGTFEFSAKEAHLAIYTNGAFQDLGVLSGDARMASARINNADQVVGSTFGADGSLKHGYYYSKATGVIDVQKLLPDFSPWTVKNAFDINDKGQILAKAIKNNIEQFVVLTPDGVSSPTVKKPAPPKKTKALPKKKRKTAH